MIFHRFYPTTTTTEPPSTESPPNFSPSLFSSSAPLSVSPLTVSTASSAGTTPVTPVHRARIYNRYNNLKRPRFLLAGRSSKSKEVEDDEKVSEGEDSTEKTQVRTQTSRSVVVRAKPKGKGKDDVSKYPSASPRRSSSSSAAAPAASAHRFRLGAQRRLRSRSRGGSGGDNSRESIVTAAKVADQVVPAPPFMKSSSLVAIRSFCRFPPLSTGRCRTKASAAADGEMFFFYNVTAAACQPLPATAYCGRSRNRFSNEQSCLEACIVESQEILDEEEQER